MSNAAYVTTGKRRTAGGIYRAPAGTALPTDATTALPEAFKNLGYVSEDGVTNSISSDSTEIKEWGGDTVDTVKTSQSDTFKFKLIEAMNVDTLKTVFGDSNVSEANGAISVDVKAADGDAAVYVVDIAFKGGRLKRIVIPSGKITELGDIVYKTDEAVGYDLTIQAALGADGATHHEYISAPSAA